ncbi:AraC family transcriptional regulator [Myroides albus]|nr:AraC family transcriptional regulator [Myroides albus]UVD79097.1 AraC family transcriptional regulator [Myroides albus]
MIINRVEPKSIFRILIHFLLPVALSIVYLTLLIIDEFLDVEIILPYFNVFNVISGIHLLIYICNVYAIVFKHNVDDFRQYFFLKLSSVFLLISIVLISFPFWGFDYIYTFKLLLGISFVALCFISASFANQYQFKAKIHLQNLNSKKVASNDLSVSSKDVKYLNSLVKSDLLTDYDLKIIDLLENKKIYLDRNLSIGKLSMMTKISRHHLSQYFNIVHESNFNNVINRYRIKHAQSLIKNDSFDMSINDLYFECGFNSRVSFFRSFKSVVGISPSEYIYLNKATSDF